MGEEALMGRLNVYVLPWEVGHGVAIGRD